MKIRRSGQFSISTTTEGLNPQVKEHSVCVVNRSPWDQIFFYDEKCLSQVLEEITDNKEKSITSSPVNEKKRPNNSTGDDESLIQKVEKKGKSLEIKSAKSSSNPYSKNQFYYFEWLGLYIKKERGEKSNNEGGNTETENGGVGVGSEGGIEIVDVDSE